MEINDFIRVVHVSRTFEEKEGPLKVLDDISFSMDKGNSPVCSVPADAEKVRFFALSPGLIPGMKVRSISEESRC